MADINTVFCRRLLQIVHADVRKAFPQIGHLYQAASATCTLATATRKQWFVEIDVPGRTRFTWDGRAYSATEARAKAWQALLARIATPDCSALPQSQERP